MQRIGSSLTTLCAAFAISTPVVFLTGCPEDFETEPMDQPQPEQPAEPQPEPAEPEPDQDPLGEPDQQDDFDQQDDQDY